MSSHTILPAAAVDLGFHTTKYTFAKLASGAEHHPCHHFPSIATALSGSLEEGTGFKLDGVCVQVNGNFFFVGPSAPRIVSAAGLHRAASSEYSTSPEYHALLLGALWHIAKEAHKGDGHLQISNLTLGLPMGATGAYRAQLKTLATCDHLLPPLHPGGKPLKVIVKQVHVLGQPQGALLHYLDTVDSSVESENVLVADLGGGTFDWYSCSSMVPTLPRCGNHDRGMLNAATEACKVISAKDVNNVDLLARIDTALRTGKTEVKISGRMVPFDQGISAANKVVDEALRHMSVSIGSTAAIDRVLLAGGGAPLLKARLPQVLPDLVDLAQMIEEPFFANLRGFLYFSLAMSQPN